MDIKTITNDVPSNDALKILRNFLEKLEQLNPEERRAIITTINLINHPIFTTTN